MTLIKQILVTFLIGFVSLIFPASKAWATTTLTFSPSSKTVTTNESVSVSVQINADTAAYAADAVILYQPDDLEFNSALKGNFFTYFGSGSDPANGRVELHGYFENLADAKTGSGTFATLIFKVKSTGGSGVVSFLCPANGSNTYILNSSGTNILLCSNTNSLNLTYNSSTPANTPVPSNTQSPNPTNTPNPAATNTPVPPSNKTPDCVGLSYLPTGTVTTMSQVTFTCQGTDSDGYLTGAEFEFGDGNTRIVSSIGGNNGRLTTSYRYVKTGTFGISCKVKDNSGAWSNIPAICKSSIKINPGSGYNPGATTPKPTTIATPTIAEITLETFSSPTPLPPLPDIYVEENQNKDENNLIEENTLPKTLLMAGGALLGIIIFSIIVKKLRGGSKFNPPVINPPTN